MARLTRRANPLKIETRHVSGLEILSMSPAEVVIYSRPGCHLCEVAKSLLQAHGLSPQEIDISTDPVLVQQYGEVIPVVLIDGKERFRGRIDEILLRRLLQGHQNDTAEERLK